MPLPPLTEADHQAIETLYQWAGQRRNRHVALNFVVPTGGGDVGWWVEVSHPRCGPDGVTHPKLYLDELEVMTEEERDEYEFPGLARVIHAVIKLAEEKGW